MWISVDGMAGFVVWDTATFNIGSLKISTASNVHLFIYLCIFHLFSVYSYADVT